MVINDLEEALKCIGTEVKDGRFNSWAVKGLLARVNLYKRDWDKAFSYAEDVIKNSPYSLLKTEDYVAAWSGSCLLYTSILNKFRKAKLD